MDQGLSAQRICQDLITEHGFTGRYPSVRRFVKQLGTSTPLPFRRIEVGPGEEAQIDSGKGAPIVDEQGRRRRTHVLRVVLTHSRKAYSEVVYRQTTDNLIAVLENAFWNFGGVRKTPVPDSLKAAVVNADWYDPDLGLQCGGCNGNSLTIQFKVVGGEFQVRGSCRVCERQLPHSTFSLAQVREILDPEDLAYLGLLLLLELLPKCCRKRF